MVTMRIAVVRAAAGLALVTLAACGSGAPKDPAPAPAPEGETQVGYGSQPKERVTGSISSVDQETIENRGSRSILDLLDDVPGVQVIRGPSGPTIRVRGGATINSSEEPLFVIDGVPAMSVESALASINPADVERIEVLKDASASIYGLRAGNGVILVRTKRPPR